MSVVDKPNININDKWRFSDVETLCDVLKIKKLWWYAQVNIPYLAYWQIKQKTFLHIRMESEPDENGNREVWRTNIDFVQPKSFEAGVEEGKRLTREEDNLIFTDDELWLLSYNVWAMINEYGDNKESQQLIDKIDKFLESKWFFE